ncbi:hypothetical protein [Mucilaginibacter arboris]|uniref:Uncharacterized protein n=1 Tax=Mucilaginibacter arboris TaxID=2682090 RepID=A0A7K1SVJ3_9SPHI|nr:hypothetical protein [Mucilaginibacter arboris]MVN21369.1 hypothetical protein [Mucilaginibacter arboris]
MAKAATGVDTTHGLKAMAILKPGFTTDIGLPMLDRPVPAQRPFMFNLPLPRPSGRGRRITESRL